MSNYTVTTNFANKDSLPSGSSDKIIRGSEFTAEFNNIATAVNSKADSSQVLTNVPNNAVFTDTVYTKPSSEPISYITGLQTALDGKVDDSQVLTNVPENALFTDTVYTKPANEPISYITGLQTALDGKVDDSQVLTNVPSGAVFTDTVYTKPASEPISYISGLQTALDALQDEIDAVGTGGGSYVSTTDADFVKLTQVTATATELNYVDGVTSNIQNQLNIIRSRLDILEGGMA